jgi:hypothetical protein
MHRHSKATTCSHNTLYVTPAVTFVKGRRSVGEWEAGTQFLEGTSSLLLVYGGSFLIVAFHFERFMAQSVFYV